MNNQVNQDLEHLKILSICYYVLAGLCVFPMLYGVLYTVMGVVFGAVFLAADVPQGRNDPPAALFGGIFVFFGLVIIAIFLTLGLLILKTGRNLSKRDNYTFCFVISCIICIFMPLGTILGIFSIIVLTRESVKGLFEGRGYSGYGNTPQNWQ
jgi:cytochrome bd-type quinol oxidase subunit 2